ncbi:MAG TPA: phosphonate C-P lyase system protein PhnH [Stellaceae bacterium]|nr:phosphonate C-P lyase system protein PhnH [Stellaceae bacterium]
MQPAAAAEGVIAPGFCDEVHGAQRCFRRVLDAMAHPGRICDVRGELAAPPPSPLVEAAAAVLLTLCDVETPLFLQQAAMTAAAYLRFHCGAPFAASPGDAQFALFSDPPSLPPLTGFALGSDEYPERATTLILQVSSLAETGGARLRGPGIRERASLAAGGLPAAFWEQRRGLQELFPRGLDILFTCGSRLAALPRSTIVEG